MKVFSSLISMQDIFEKTAPFPYYVYENKVDKLSRIALGKINSYCNFPLKSLVRMCGVIVAEAILLFFIKDLLLFGLVVGFIFISIFSSVAVWQLLIKRSKHQLVRLVTSFLGQCEHLAASLEDSTATHLISIQGIDSLINLLEIEVRLFPRMIDRCNRPFSTLLEKYKNDITYNLAIHLYEHKRKQIIALIGISAQEPSFHARLALCQIEIGKLYEHKQKKDLWTLSYQKAIDELKIVAENLHDQTWALEKMAFCYEKLEQMDLLIQVMEKQRYLKPDDVPLLKKLAMLYFRSEYKGKGLEIYEKMRGLNSAIAQELLQFYSER